MSELEIRDAVAADAPSACDVLRRSIVELCAADHRNDPKILAQWFANKRGEITLNYVLPDARFRGVSRALLAALERRAAERGNGACRLTSTATARRFYLANGYVETGAARGNFGTQSASPCAGH